MQTARHVLTAQDNALNFNAQLNDVTRQEKKQLSTQQIEKAAASGGARDTAHATSASTRDGADSVTGVEGHVLDDGRKLLAMSAAHLRQKTLLVAGAPRVLRGSLRSLQQGGISNVMTDSMRSVERQTRVAATSSMIRRAVDGQADATESGRPAPAAAEKLSGPVVAQGAALP